MTPTPFHRLTVALVRHFPARSQYFGHPIDDLQRNCLLHGKGQQITGWYAAGSLLAWIATEGQQAEWLA